MIVVSYQTVAIESVIKNSDEFITDTGKILKTYNDSDEIKLEYLPNVGDSLEIKGKFYRAKAIVHHAPQLEADEEAYTAILVSEQ